jgi:hypothetical protein
LQTRLGYSLFCPLNHLWSEIYSDHFTLFPDLVGSQNDINPAAATEIHDNIPGLKVRKAGGITTTP